jgi:asparagine N-glycosylation enzyme membrane subunit Stt3
MSAGIVMLLIAAAVARPGRRQRAIQWLSLSLLLLLPVALGMNEWYGMGFIVPFALLIMEGAAACFAWAGSFVSNPDRTFTLGLSVACVLAAALWLTALPPGAHGLLLPRGGTHFLLTRPAVTRAAAVSRFFASAPRDAGIMAPTDLSPEVVYLTDKRVVALPFDPGLLDQFIEEYHISYVLASNEFLRRYDPPIADQYTSSLSHPFYRRTPSTVSAGLLAA